MLSLSLRSLFLTIPAVLVLHACSGAANKPPGAYFEIPVYEPSKLEDSMGSTSGGDGFVVKGMGWKYSTSADPAKIVSWYKKKLPSAEKSDGEEGSIVLNYKPKTAEEHELVQIHVGKGEFWIHEDVLPGKRKD